MNKIENLLNNKNIINPLTITILIYVFSLLILGSWYNFPISDDFYYTMQVEAFSMGIFTKSALIGPTLILQSFIGLIWGRLFGINYASLRVLTILFSILCIVIVDKILKLLKVKDTTRLPTLLLILFIPQFYACSVTFMSENYFLFFILLSLYHFLSFLNKDDEKHMLLASIFGGLSIMVRQYGVVLLITYLFVYVMLVLKYKKLNIRLILELLVPFILLGSLGVFWPKFKSLSDPKSMDVSLFFVGFKDVIPRIFNIWVLPYIGFYLLPFSVVLFGKINNKLKALIMILSVPLSYLIYKINIFKIGNLFYLEGLYARLVVNIRQNLFNNVPFKLFLAYLISLSLITLLIWIIQSLVSKRSSLEKKNFKINLKSITKDLNTLTLIVSIIGFFLIVMVTDRVFDRYLLNFFIFLVILVSYIFSKNRLNLNSYSLLMCILISFVTFLVTFDYYRGNQLKWVLANKLSTEYKVDKYNIFVDNVYARTMYMYKMQNYKGLYPAKPAEYHPFCFVQEYVRQKDNVINKLVNSFEGRGFVKKYIENPKISNAGLLKEKSNHFDSTDILIYDVEYPSPIYNLLGKKMFIRAFCLYNYKDLQ
ncbi:glycosyltransferase family 39 protein [candidate division WWE3 bacterium]|uniref:Glycosyltransferase family 39 protein n=1 Tax=candidate division WWE3 bacterium TaxID=2053526 RepID=A0A7X9HSZ6_UNCKA|nr:glycosyltransferase family 39 protein [candidate division WWE3 bacterium]